MRKTRKKNREIVKEKKKKRKKKQKRPGLVSLGFEERERKRLNLKREKNNGIMRW